MIKSEKFISLADLSKYYGISIGSFEKELGNPSYEYVNSVLPTEKDIIKHILREKPGVLQGARLGLLAQGMQAMGTKSTSSSPIARWATTELRKSLESNRQISLREYQTLIVRKGLKQCILCGNEYEESSTLTAHVLKHNSNSYKKNDLPNAFYCDNCGYGASSELELQSHQRETHTNFQSPYKQRDEKGIDARIKIFEQMDQQVSDYFQREKEKESRGTLIQWPQMNEVRQTQSQTNFDGLRFSDAKRRRSSLPEPEVTGLEDSERGSI